MVAGSACDDAWPDPVVDIASTLCIPLLLACFHRAVAIAGSTFPIVGVVLSSIFVMTMVTGEKARRLVGALRTIGLLDSAYWISWLVGSLPVLLLLALIAAGVGVATGIELYTRADYSVHFVGLFMLATSTTSMALCCSSFVRSQRAVNITAFCLFAVAATTAVLFVMLGASRSCAQRLRARLWCCSGALDLLGRACALALLQACTPSSTPPTCRPSSP